MPPGGYVEVRSIRQGKVHQWWESDRQAAVDLALGESDKGWEAYFGVLPRIERAGGSEAISAETTVLWADLDAKLVGSKQLALQRLTRAYVSPSVVVDSGHGYHAYWKLDAPVPWHMAYLAMRGIAQDLRGDHVYDMARILRIPGTMNWKDPDYPMPVRAIVFDTTNVRRFRDFHCWSEEGFESIEPPPSRLVGYRVVRSEAGWLEDLIRDGAPQGQRSEQAFKVMCELARRGFNDGEILATFESGGIGEKMREMRDGQRWFERSLARARAQL